MTDHTCPGNQPQRGPASSAPADASRREWVVNWSMPIDANSAIDAAIRALEIHRDPASLATVFRVEEPDGSSVLVDVQSSGGAVILERTPSVSPLDDGNG